MAGMTNAATNHRINLPLHSIIVSPTSNCQDLFVKVLGKDQFYYSIIHHFGQ